MRYTQLRDLLFSLQNSGRGCYSGHNLRGHVVLNRFGAIGGHRRAVDRMSATGLKRLLLDRCPDELRLNLVAVRTPGGVSAKRVHTRPLGSAYFLTAWSHAMLEIIDVVYNNA